MAEVIFHIGHFKTGTTTLQNCTYNNRQYLRTQGLEIFTNVDDSSLTPFEVSLSFTDSFRGSKFIQSRAISGDISYDDLKKTHGEILKYNLNRNFNRLLISSEMLVEVNVNELIKLKEHLDSLGITCKILCYVRHPAYAASSIIQQELRSGNVEFTDVRNISIPFRSYLEGYLEVFGTESVQVREFSKEQFVDGDLIADFFNAIGMHSVDLRKLDVENYNERISRQAAAILQAVNEEIPAPHFPKDRVTNLRSGRLGSIFHDIAGEPFSIPSEDAMVVYKNSLPDIRWLRKLVGYEIFPEPDPSEFSKPGSLVWDQEILKSIGLKINDLLIENAKLKARINIVLARQFLEKGDLQSAEKRILGAARQDPQNSSIPKLRQRLSLQKKASKYKGLVRR